MSNPIVVHVVSGGTDWTTRALAIFGAVVSTASVTWQTVSYRLGGPRVRAVLKRGYLGPGHVITSPISVDQGASLAQQGYTLQLLAVEVTNVGRLPISIESVSTRDEHGAGISTIGALPAVNPDLPHRLEAFSSATWHIDLATAVRVVRGSGSTKVWMVATPAGGKPVRTKEHLRVT